MQKSLTLEAIPQAILELINKVDTIQADISELEERHIPKVEEAMIWIAFVQNCLQWVYLSIL